MLSRTRLFDPGHLLMAMPKWPCPARHGHYPLYPKGYKGVKWPCLSSAPPAPSRGHVWPCRNARSFLLLASAHCPQAPPLPFGASGYPPRRPACGPEAEGGAATHAAKRLF